jgi:hypothetical protein
MEWVIALTGIALVVYVFGVPSAHTRRIADHVAAGAAGGSRNATSAYFRRRDWGLAGGWCPRRAHLPLLDLRRR